MAFRAPAAAGGTVARGDLGPGLGATGSPAVSSELESLLSSSESESESLEVAPGLDAAALGLAAPAAGAAAGAATVRLMDFLKVAA